MELNQQPIMNIEWIEVDKLVPNAWNPNVVIAPELKLLKLSLMQQGWIQPVLVNREGDGYEIIDGFHRSTLCKTDKDIAEMTGGKVPCAVLDLPVSERKMLTVRINRAKGSHQAIKMHELVRSLVYDHEVPIKVVAKGIGASSHEVQHLLTENIFKKLDVENTPYSQAWRPRKPGETGDEITDFEREDDAGEDADVEQ